MTDHDPANVKRLFQAVVTQALIDACSTPKMGKDKHAYAQKMRDRDDARKWLLKDNDGFPEVVSLAGYNPDDIRARSHNLAARGWVHPRVEMALAA